MAKAKPPKKTSGKSSGGKKIKLPSKTLIAVILSLFLIGLGASFIPQDSVPKPLEGIHKVLLASRNTVIAKSGLPISRYEDCYSVENLGSPPIKLYFAPSPKISGKLCDFIASAQKSLDVCVYDLDLQDVADSLIKARRLGVSVRVVTDDSNYCLPAIGLLNKAGIKVRQDKRREIMHNKFVVADCSRVWTGSFNFTRNCAYKNDNNALIIDSSAVAMGYTAKFEEYWGGKFGPDASRQSVNSKTFMGKVPVEFAFSPADGVKNKILDELSRAKWSVYVMAFSFTSDEIASKLVTLAGKGVKVRCIFDAGQAANAYSKDDFLRKSGLNVRMSPNTSGKMHHKVIIIDNDTVITGSYNFSNNAEKANDENILIIRSVPLANEFKKEFMRCWDGIKGY